jgi:hypothetical protein
MTWFWFALFGVIALVSRKPIIGWVSNWSDNTLKQCAAAGLIGFGIMATFGLPLGANVWFLHLAAGISGVLGFFAVNEIANRSAANRQVNYEARLRSRLEEYRSQQRAKTGMPRNEGSEGKLPDSTPPTPRREPPLIKIKDSQENILDLLTRAAENWDNPEIDIDSTKQVPEQAEHQTYQSMSQILARAAETQPRTGMEAAEVPAAASAAGASPKIDSLAHDSRETVLDEQTQHDAEPSPDNKTESDASSETHSSEAIDGEQQVDEQDEKAVAEEVRKQPMSRESGPISLVESTPIRPPGPISLAPASAVKTAADVSARHPEGFVYQPKLVRSRLSGAGTSKKSNESGGNHTSSDQPEESAKDEAPAASA